MSSLGPDQHVEHHRVVIVGEGGVGKTAITLQLTSSHFVKEYDPTIENSYRKMMNVDGSLCMLDILDTAGQEEYSAMRDQYFRTGHGFIFVFSVTDRKSFESIKGLHLSVRRVQAERESVPCVVLANKVDLVEDRDVTSSEGTSMAKTLGVPYLEVSAKTRTNVEEGFCTCVREIRRIAAKAKGPSGSGSGPEGKTYRRKKESLCAIL
eukprot:m51a1_g6836 putative ras gtpase (208) ;mRNA; f:57381-58610